MRLLVKTVLEHPSPTRLAATTMTLCLVPQEFYEKIPELEEAALEVRVARSARRGGSFFLSILVFLFSPKDLRV